MKKQLILSKSKIKGKRFKIEMKNFDNMEDHHHDFGSKIGTTYIDGATEKQKSNWIARHSTNKNYESIHSPIYFSKMLLWNTPDLASNIKLLSKKLNANIIVKFKL